jgi:1-acyl-sn-glycerol-3-phosphate acyltransferase
MAALRAGHSVKVEIGGIGEMFLGSSDCEATLIKRRRGFIRVALQAGVDIVPVYHFGNSQLYFLYPRCEFSDCVDMSSLSAVTLILSAACMVRVRCPQLL